MSEDSQTALAGGWQEKSFAASLTADESVKVTPARAQLEKGDRIAVQAYYETAGGGTAAVELGSPFVTPVSKTDDTSYTYSAREYFPPLYSDGTMNYSAYTPINSRFTYEAVYFKENASGAVEAIGAAEPLSALTNVSTAPEVRASYSGNAAKRPGVVINGTNLTAFQFVPVEPFDDGSGELIYAGMQIRWTAEESGLATLKMSSNLSALISGQLVRIVKGGRVISSGSVKGNWNSNSPAGILSAGTLVERGDELIFQFCHNRVGNTAYCNFKDITVDVTMPQATRYALQNVNGSLPSDVLGPCWYYRAGDFTADPDQAILEFTDSKIWPELTHTAWGVGYTFYNSTVKRSIAFNMRDTGAARYGMSFSYKAQEKSLCDFGWTLIAKAGAPAGTLFYRVIKVTADETAPLIDGDWQSVSLADALAEDFTVGVPAIRADLDEGESLVVEAYFKAETGSGSLTIELGSPAVIPVTADENGKITYSAKNYYPPLLTDGSVSSPNYIPVSDRFVFEGIYVMQETDSVKCEVVATGRAESLVKGTHIYFENPFVPAAKPYIIINGSNMAAWQFAPTVPLDVDGETIYTGVQVRFTAAEDGIAIIHPSSRGGPVSDHFVRAKKNGVTIFGGASRGDWKTGSIDAAFTTRVTVKKGDELVWQFFSIRTSSGSMHNFVDMLVDFEPITDENNPDYVRPLTDVYVGLKGDMLQYFKELAAEKGSIGFAEALVEEEKPPVVESPENPIQEQSEPDASEMPPEEYPEEDHLTAENGDSDVSGDDNGGTSSKPKKPSGSDSEEEEEESESTIRRTVYYGLPALAIVLIVVGGVALLGAAVFLILLRKKKKGGKDEQESLNQSMQAAFGKSPTPKDGGTK
jgi:hypothetical protein